MSRMLSKAISVLSSVSKLFTGLGYMFSWVLASLFSARAVQGFTVTEKDLLRVQPLVVALTVYTELRLGVMEMVDVVALLNQL